MSILCSLQKNNNSEKKINSNNVLNSVTVIQSFTVAYHGFDTVNTLYATSNITTDAYDIVMYTNAQYNASRLSSVLRM